MKLVSKWWGSAVLAMVTGSAALVVLPGSAVAADEVVLSPDQVNEMLFVAGDVSRLEDQPHESVLERVLQQMYLDRPALAAAEATAEIARLRQAVEPAALPDATSGNEQFLAALADMAAAAPSGHTGAAVRMVAEQALDSAPADGGVGELRMTPSIDSLATLGEGTLAPTSVLEMSFQLAASNASFAQARDELWESATGQSVLDSVAARLADPDLASSKAITDQIQGETLTISRVEVMAAAEQQLAVAADARSAAMVAVDAVEDQKDVVKAAAPTQKEQAEAELKALKAQVKKEADGREAVITGAKNAVSLMTTIIELFDPKLAGEIETVATAVIDVAEKVNDLVGVIASIGVNLAAQNYFGLVKDTLGLVTGLQGLFGGEASKKPDPVKLALKQLREDLGKLRAEMNTRFDRVDKGLNQIYGTMVTRLGEIEAKIDGVASDVRAAFDELVKQQVAMERLEQRLYGAIKDASDRDLHVAINTAIGWRDRSVGGAPMSNELFLEYAGKFHSWTQTSAFDQVALVPDPRLYDDEALVVEVAHPLDRNIDYLRQFGAKRFGLAPLGNDRLPNPRDWAVASRAYGQLLLENPQYMTSGLASWLTQVEAKGNLLAAALSGVGRSDTTVGTGSQLLNGTLDLYRARWDELHAGVQAVQKAHHDSLPFAGDLWGGSNQVPPTPENVTTTCHGLPLGAGSTYDERVPRSAALAADIGMGSTKACASAGWVDERMRIVTMTSGWTTTTYYGKLRSSMSWTFDMAEGTDLVLSRGTHTGAEQIICQETMDNEGGISSSSCDGVQDDPERRMQSNWSSIKDHFSFTDDAANRTALASAVDTWLVDAQKESYRRVQKALDDSTNPLAESARRLTAVKRLLGMYAHAGMPRALEVDDELRGLLEGSDRLLDQDEERVLSASWAAAVTSPPARNLATVLDEVATGRADALEQLLRAHVLPAAPSAADEAPAVGTAQQAVSGTGPSAPSLLIATTLDRLRLVRFVLTGPRVEPLDPEVEITKVVKATKKALLAGRTKVVVDTTVDARLRLKVFLRSKLVAKSRAEASAGTAKLVPRATKAGKRLLRRQDPVKVTVVVTGPDGQQDRMKIRLR